MFPNWNLVMKRSRVVIDKPVFIDSTHPRRSHDARAHMDTIQFNNRVAIDKPVFTDSTPIQRSHDACAPTDTITSSDKPSLNVQGRSSSPGSVSPRVSRRKESRSPDQRGLRPHAPDRRKSSTRPHMGSHHSSFNRLWDRNTSPHN